MATIHVWSGATGAADGTSWTDAYTTMGAAVTAWTSADVIYIHAGATAPHSESSATDLGYTGGTENAPIPVYCVDKNNSDAAITDPETSGAPLITVSGSLGDSDHSGSFSFHGFWLRVGRSFTVEGIDSVSRYVNCRLDVGWEASGQILVAEPRKAAYFYDCTYSMGNGPGITGSGNFRSPSHCHIIGGEVIGNALASNALFVFVVAGKADVLCRGVDLSGAPIANSDNIVFANNDAFSGTFLFDGCVFPDTTWSLAALSGAGDVRVELRKSDDSTGAAYRREMATLWGNITTDTGVSHDAGYSAEDGATTGVPLSRKMAPSSICDLEQPLVGLPAGVYIATTGAKTITVECIEDFTTALQNDEAWLEYEYYATAGDTLLTRGSTRVFPASTTADLTAGTGLANWTGEGAGTRSVKFTASITINNVGILRARVYLAKYESGKALWVDPKIAVA